MRFREQHAICGGYQLTGCHARRASRDEGRLYPDGHFGIYVAEPFERAVKDQLAFLAWHLDLLGVWRTLRALPHVQRHDGNLLAISSMAAFVYSPLRASYTASKAGVWALCDRIRLELRHLGVGVGSAHPTCGCA